MTRDKPQPGPYTDERVSRSYRDLATEAAPEHLDAAILRQAALATPSQYARSLAWTRPVAWAATIVLCVAVVLELTQAPQPDGTIPPADVRFDAAPAAKPAPVEQSAAKASAEEPAPLKAETLRDQAAADDVRQPAVPLDAAAFKPRDTDMLRRAEETAKLRSGANLEARAPGVLGEVTPACAAAAIATPETWLDCIKALEEAGQTAEAENERRLLEAAFPDFDAH